MNFAEKIVDAAHESGVRFTFDKDCIVIGCKNLAKWDQDITHAQQGKITLELCEQHMKDFDQNKVFKIKVSKK